MGNNQFHGTKSRESIVSHNVKSDQKSSNRPLYNFSSHLANSVSCRSHNNTVSSDLENLSFNIHDSYIVATCIDGEDTGHDRVNSDYDCDSDDDDENLISDLPCIDYDYDNVTSKHDNVSASSEMFVSSDHTDINHNKSYVTQNDVHLVSTVNDAIAGQQNCSLQESDDTSSNVMVNV